MLNTSDIACDSENQNPLFVKYERKPGFVIKSTHYFPLSENISKLLLSYDVTMITEMRIKSKRKYMYKGVSIC